MTTKVIFQDYLNNIFLNAEKKGLKSIEVKAGDLHKMAGGYPGPNHRMPVCCEVMYQNMKEKDELVSKPPKGKGASLTIRYTLPRDNKKNNDTTNKSEENNIISNDNQKIERLKQLGFELCGFWKLDEKKEDVQYELYDKNPFIKKRVIYAFVMESPAPSVKYIGICESKHTTFKIRMDRYINQRSTKNSTNVNICKRIYEALSKGYKVLIYAFSPEKAKYAETDLDIDLVKGLESELILNFNTLEPSGWNKKS